MKKAGLVIVLILATLVLVSCGVPSEDYIALLDDYNSLRLSNEQLSIEYDKALKAIEEQKLENEHLSSELSKSENEYSVLQHETEIKITSMAGQLELERHQLLEQNKALLEELEAYRQTGISIHEAIEVPKIAKYLGKPDDYVSLHNNSSSDNPTYSSLLAFLANDDTDSYPYAFISEGRLCGWYAERIHNNAELAGIRAAFVVIDLIGEEGHALNAFVTIDKGLVFIDCTGARPDLPQPISPNTITYEIGDTGSHDTIAYIQRDKPIGWINIGLNYGLSYSEYKRWEQGVESMRTYFKSAPNSELEQLVKESDAKLGSFFVPSFGIVDEVEIYW